MTDRSTSWPARIPGVRFGQRLADRFVRNRVAEGIGELLPRLDEVDRRIAAVDSRIDRVEARLAEVTGHVEVHEQSRHEHWARMHELHDQVGLRVQRVTFDVDRLSPAVAALEVRAERLSSELADRSPDAPASDDGTTARDLLREARREHEQVRVRLSAIAAYEERLRRIESAVAEETASGAAAATGS